MNILKQALSYIPESLPVGLTEFEAFTDDVIELAGPYADRDSMQWVISSAIQHSSKAKLSKQYFVQTLRKSAANQVAGQVFMNIKIKQQAAEAKKAAELAQQAAAPAIQEAGANVEVLSDKKV